MNRLALLLLGVFLTAPAHGFPFRKPPQAYTQARADFENKLYKDVIKNLTPDVMLTLKRRHLKKAYAYLGISHEKTGRLDMALSVYQLGVNLYPRDITLRTRLGRLYQYVDMHAQALPHFKRSLKLAPKNTEAHLGLAEIYHALGFLGRSADHYEIALETLKEDGRIWRDYTEVLLEQHEIKTAELSILKALEFSPKDKQARLLQALILREQGKDDDALLILSGLSLAKEGPEPMRLIEALWLLEAKRYKEAKTITSAVITDWPSQPLARWIRARANLQLGKKRAAVKDLEVAAASRESAFVAEVSTALLKEIGGTR